MPFISKTNLKRYKDMYKDMYNNINNNLNYIQELQRKNEILEKKNKQLLEEIKLMPYKTILKNMTMLELWEEASKYGIENHIWIQTNIGANKADLINEILEAKKELEDI